MTKEEAIQKIKWEIAGLIIDKDAREALETLIPELRENEDERIGDLIFCLIRDRSDNRKLLEHNGVSVAEALSYLEKKKHSLNFDAISSWLRDHMSRYVNSEYNEFHNCTEYDGTINIERLIADLKVAVDSGAFDIHEQKEQKPWKPSKEQMEAIDRCVNYLEESDNEDAEIMESLHEQLKAL